MAEPIEMRVDDLEQKVAGMDNDIREQFAASNAFVAHAVNAAEARLNGRMDRLELTVVEFNERMATRIEARLTARIDDVETRSSARIADVETRLSARIADVETRLSARIADVETRVSARVDNVETCLSADMVDLEERIITRVSALLTQMEARLLQRPPS